MLLITVFLNAVDVKSMYVYVYVHAYTIIIMWSVPETFEKILLLPLSRINVVSLGAESPNEPSKALQRLHTFCTPSTEIYYPPTDVQTTPFFFFFWLGGEVKKIFKLLACGRPKTKQKLDGISAKKTNPERAGINFICGLVDYCCDVSLIYHAEKFLFSWHQSVSPKKSCVFEKKNLYHNFIIIIMHISFLKS